MNKEKLLEMGLSEKQAEEIIKMNSQSVNEAKIQLSVENALIRHKAKNVKAVLALIDFDKIINEGEEGLSGIEEQIEALKNSEETSFLFDNAKGKIVGAPAEEGKDRGKPKNLRNMTYTEMCRYMK